MGPELRGIYSLQDREGRVHIRFNGILAQQGRAEGGADRTPRRGQACAEVPQALPLWFGQVLVEGVGQPPSYALAHLRRGLLGKGDGQHLAHANLGMQAQQLDVAFD